MGFFDYFFGPKGQSEQQQKNNKAEDQTWIYELIYEHLNSPIWKITISEFMDENCIYFDEEEGNKLEYQQKFKEFKKMMSDQFDNMIKEIGITEQQLAQQILKGLGHSQHKIIFQQLLIIDDYQIFKKQMIKRNKELELEAMRELEKIDQQKKNNNEPRQNQEYPVNPNQYPQFDQKFEQQRLEIENEKAELELAIELSKKAEEEQRRQLDDNESEELKAILEESLKEYNDNLKRQLQTIQKKEEQMKQMPQYNQSQLLKSIKQINYPTFESYKQRQNKPQLYPYEEDEESTIVKVEENPRFQIQPPVQPELIKRESDDLPLQAPVIGRVESELLEDDSQSSNKSEHLQEQKMKILQQKEILIRKKSELNKSELLKFQRERPLSTFKV